MSQKNLSDFEPSGAECPKCGDTFKSEHGVKVHYARSHDGSIAGVEVECSQCGSPLRREENQVERSENHFCSEECNNQYRRENFTPHNKVDYPTVECEHCGGGFQDSALHVHHIIPLVAGGTNGEYNLIPLCESCHATVEWKSREIIPYEHRISRGGES